MEQRFDASYAFDPDLSGTKHEQEASAAQGLAILVAQRRDRPPETGLVR